MSINRHILQMRRAKQLVRENNTLQVDSSRQEDDSMYHRKAELGDDKNPDVTTLPLEEESGKSLFGDVDLESLDSYSDIPEARLLEDVIETISLAVDAVSDALELSNSAHTKSTMKLVQRQLMATQGMVKDAMAASVDINENKRK